MPLLQQLRYRLPGASALRPMLEGVPAAFQRPDENITLITWNRISAALPADSSDRLAEMVQELARRKFLCSACWVLPEGVAATLVQACAPQRLGAHVCFYLPDWESAEQALFGRHLAAIVTCASPAHCALSNAAERTGDFLTHPIGRTTPGDFHVEWQQAPVICTTIASLLEPPGVTIQNQCA